MGGRFDQLNEGNQAIVLAAAEKTVDKLTGPAPDVWEGREPLLRAKQIANDPRELNDVLRAAGVPTQHERKAARSHPRINSDSSELGR